MNAITNSINHIIDASPGIMLSSSWLSLRP